MDLTKDELFYEYTHPSFTLIKRGCEEIRGKIQTDDVVPDVILGLSRGGLIPAVILSHLFDDVPLEVASFSSSKGSGDKRKNKLKTPNLPKKSTILVVDEICDSGHTLNDLHQHLVGSDYTVYTAAVYFKRGAVHTPTYSYITIPSDAPWIIFPWE